MQEAQALAVRRAALIAAAVAATVAAHHASTGTTSLHDGTPALWLGYLAVAVLVGHRARPLRPRGPLAVLGSLLGAQLAGHVVLVHAPWALGLAGHPAAGPAVPVTAVVAHTAAAVLLTVILSCVDAILAALCTAAARLAAALPGRRRTGGDGRRPVPEARHGGSAGGRPRTRPPRGPPVLVTT